jgi:hypothetical protein
MAFIEILEAVEAAPRGNARIEVLAQHKNNLELKQYLNYALSPDITFGVAQMPEAKPQSFDGVRVGSQT